MSNSNKATPEAIEAWKRPVDASRVLPVSVVCRVCRIDVVSQRVGWPLIARRQPSDALRRWTLMPTSQSSRQ